MQICSQLFFNKIRIYTFRTSPIYGLLCVRTRTRKSYHIAGSRARSALTTWFIAIGFLVFGGDIHLRILRFAIRSLQSSSDYAGIQSVKILLPSRYRPYVAFPYSYHPPAQRLKVCFVACITGYVALYLLPPEIDIRLRQPEIPATLVAVPETSVDKNNRLVFRQNNVRPPRKFLTLNPIAQTS